MSAIGMGFRAAAAALVLALAACAPSGQGGSGGQATGGGGGDAAAAGCASGGVVNVYNARHYDSDRQVFDQFTARTGIQVRQIQGNAEQLQARLEAEGADSPADVVITVDAGNLWRLEAAGLLQPVTTPALEAAVPATLRSNDWFWYGFSRRARVIAYDRQDVRPEQVATYDSLASPAMRGRVCVRPASNVYNLSFLAALIERRGEDQARTWAAGVTGNFARRPEGNDTDQLRAVAAGVCDVALVNHYYLLRLARSQDPADRAVAQRVALSFPDQNASGTHINISGAGVARHAPNRDNAVRLLEFLVSAEGQTLLARGNDEYPASPATPSGNPELDALGNFTADPIEMSAYGRNQATAAAIFNEVGWP